MFLRLISLLLLSLTIQFDLYGDLNKNYYVVRNAGCSRSRYTLKLSHFFKSMNQSINGLTEYI